MKTNLPNNDNNKIIYTCTSHNLFLKREIENKLMNKRTWNLKKIKGMYLKYLRFVRDT